MTCSWIDYLYLTYCPCPSVPKAGLRSLQDLGSEIRRALSCELEEDDVSEFRGMARQVSNMLDSGVNTKSTDPEGQFQIT